MKNGLVTLLALITLNLISCKMEKVIKVHTEILCPDGLRIFVRYARMSDVDAAIKKAAKDKKELRTSEKYTAVRFDLNRSFKLDLPPEQAVNCSLREFEANEADKKRAGNFFR